MNLVYAASVPPALINIFLSLHEPFCVQLMERLCEKDAQIFCLTENQTVCGIIFITKAGLMLHCFAPELSAVFCRKAAHVLGCLFRERSIYCISGGAAGTDLLIRAAAESGCTLLPEVRPYVLMRYTGGDMPPAVSAVPVVLCCEEHASFLHPLQREYDMVEVLPAGQAFDERLSRYNLLKGLRLNRVFGITLPDGTGFAAKASISAVSVRYVQIGGVFTVPEYRNKGYAAALVRHIAVQAARTGSGSVLFVKVCNTAARAAYVRAGFSECGAYKIAYYTV